MIKLIFCMLLFKIIFTQNDSSKFIEEEFKKYIKKYNKSYLTKLEYLKHLDLFNSSFQKVINHNKNNSFKLSLNKFSDLTKEEKKKYKTGGIKKHEVKLNKKFLFSKNTGGGEDYSDKDIDKEDMDLPMNFDYRELGGINEVTSQGICGACAVFSIVSLIEHYYFMKENELKKFSEQQIIDCAFDEDICTSGSTGWDILKYIEKNGIMEYENYPYESGYTGTKSRCRYKKNNVVKISGYRLVDKPKAINIKKYLYKYGPISTSINSDCIEDYYDGIVDYSGSICKNSIDDVNHAVTIVGWDHDEETQTDYWIVRNSWGKEWGKDGYMYVKFGTNTLGIENQIYYVSSNFIKSQKFLIYFILMILF